MGKKNIFCLEKKNSQKSNDFDRFHVKFPF